MIGCIVVAAGRGKRFKNKPILEYSLETFSMCEMIDEIVLVVQEKYLKNKAILLLQKRLPKIKAITAGGSCREESVFNGFEKLSETCDIILIHDGARPFVSMDLIKSVINGTEKYGACIPCLPVNGSAKITKKGKLEKTIFEKDLEIAQTPQGFRRSILKKAFEFCKSNLAHYPDESSMCLEAGLDVHTVKGKVQNIKITTPEDVLIASAILELMERGVYV